LHQINNKNKDVIHFQNVLITFNTVAYCKSKQPQKSDKWKLSSQLTIDKYELCSLLDHFLDSLHRYELKCHIYDDTNGIYSIYNVS